MYCIVLYRRIIFRELFNSSEIFELANVHQNTFLITPSIFKIKQNGNHMLSKGAIPHNSRSKKQNKSNTQKINYELTRLH